MRTHCHEPAYSLSLYVMPRLVLLYVNVNRNLRYLFESGLNRLHDSLRMSETSDSIATAPLFYDQ